MLSSILTLVVRNFFRNLSYSAITLSSLVVGLTTAILLFLWISYEVNYDGDHPDKERVFALLTNEMVEGEVETEEGTYAPLMDYLHEIPEIECATRIDNAHADLANGDKSVQKVGVYGDSAFFQVHPVSFVAGNYQQPFSDKHSIAISDELAGLLFYRGDAIGKTILMNGKTEFKITSIYLAYPKNSSFNYVNFVLPFDSKVRAYDEWTNYDIKLYDAATRVDVEKKIDAKHQQLLNNPGVTSLLFSLKDWRLHWSFENGKSSGGRIVYVIIFGVTGLFILIMACINYMNIATARATKRSREIGVRKMTGATQATLIRQFMIESLIIAFIAAGISLFIAYILLPFFNQLIRTSLAISFTDPVLLGGLFCIALFAGILAGSYPAFLLSSFKPAVVLKGNLYPGVSGSGLRKALVVFQFSLSVIIVFCSFIMWKQTNFLLKKDIGYDKQQVINVWLDNDGSLPFENMKAEMLSHSSIEAAAFGGASPMEVNGYAEANRVSSPLQNPILMYGANIDEDVLSTLKFDFVAGRNFSHEFASDSNNFVITQSAADLLGLKNPIGERISYKMFGEQQGEIVGVIKDFQNDDIHTSMKPVVFALGKREYLTNLFIRYKQDKVDEAIAHITAVHQKFQPNNSLFYSFLDADFENQFYQEKLLGRISLWFTCLAIIIACLGLFGLVLFNAQRRTKEIGIRKVLGASVSQMIYLLCRDFLSPVFISFLVAFPVAYYLMQKFLEGYPSRINLSVFYFVAVACIMIALVAITTSYQSLKAARQNPVDSLKTE